MPSAAHRQKPVDHSTPARREEGDTENHSERLGPLRQGSIKEMVRTSPDINEDQRPKVKDRQAIGINRLIHGFRKEIIHQAEKGGRKKKADGVMPIPPLHQGIL